MSSVFRDAICRSLLQVEESLDTIFCKESIEPAGETLKLQLITNGLTSSKTFLRICKSIYFYK